MSSLCCFWCPAPDFKNRAAGECCPTCGRDYEFPLLHQPKTIGQYTVLESISRGFYSATYRARQESLNRTAVLKVVPSGIYDFFKKDWTRECQEHAAIAEGNPFVANITDQFTGAIDFSGSQVECFVAVLENLIGPTLEQALTDPNKYEMTPRAAAQIAADLYEILHLFIQRERFHNDLHAGNIIINRLPPHNLRSGSIESGIRAVAIDLGSVLDADRSGDHQGRVLSDQHQVARHISRLAAVVQTRRRSDLDYRIAGTLLGLAEHLTPETSAQRLMTVNDASASLRTALGAIDEPWRQPLSLHRFGDAYNAQALESWHVPELWFDPDDKWLTRTTARGPQVITGMRGCGKTMLLRALHFHARAAQAVKLSSVPEQIARLGQDQFVGLYASCSKLLDPQHHRDKASGDISRPFERLYVAYVRDAIRVLRHLRSIDRSAVLAPINVLLADSLTPLDFASRPDLGPSEQALEQFLVDVQFQLAEGQSGCKLRMAPVEAFSHLATTIQSSTPLFAGKYLLYLLDDVSTRYLHYDMVRELISRLLFQHSACGFRITTEAQALHRLLLSPGGSAPADPSRDYEEFDLGNEVYRLLQEGSTKQRMGFVSEILRRRGRQFHDELYRRDPEELLGDVSLQDIALEIANSSATSRARKRVYRGLRAVQAVCVGDLGDIVKLYEKILLRANPNERTVPDEKQSDCFLEHSAGLMHFLNRRDEHKKSLALSFAQAAGELLQRSVKASPQRTLRLRQYTKLYVRVDAGPNFDSVVTKLLDLLDAGVFVYDGGSPRSKTRDSDPVLQFKLSFRKLLGLASYIGLADRDRFELSGENLTRWLSEPASAKDILVESESKNEGNDDSVDDRADLAHPLDADSSTTPFHEQPSIRQSAPRQLTLAEVPIATSTAPVFPPSLDVSTASVTLESLSLLNVELMILARGFEDRAYESARQLLGVVQPKRILVVRYDDTQGKRLEELLLRGKVPVEYVSAYEQLDARLAAVKGDVVVDASGLSKALLFITVRNALRCTGRVTVVHTLAEQYFPRNEDLEARGISMGSSDSEVLSLMDDVLMGERGPYSLIQIHEQVAEPERWRTLIASTSPKNDRLLHLLDARAYDAVRIFVPPATSLRRRVTRAAAQLSASAADSNVGLIDVDTNDLDQAMKEAGRIYNELYFGSGANVEIGLTGSKMHAVAFGALAAAVRVSSAWYVVPKQYDEQRFTKGVGATHCFDIQMRTESDVKQPR